MLIEHVHPEILHAQSLACETQDDPDKTGTFSRADLSERAGWSDEMQAYCDCLSNTGTAPAPWYVVPADDKKHARLIVSQALVDTIDTLKMRYPAPLASARERKAIRKKRAS